MDFLPKNIFLDTERLHWIKNSLAINFQNKYHSLHRKRENVGLLVSRADFFGLPGVIHPVFFYPRLNTKTSSARDKTSVSRVMRWIFSDSMKSILSSAFAAS